jgi:2-polyprenyl-3-methyl-5-hydroxy-6-metoxy-1,4-benzoquinol methylase
MKEIEFKKYKQRGAYHWRQVSRNPFKRQPFVHGRYLKMVNLVQDNAGQPLSGKTVLDIGCGDGVLTNMLAKKGMLASGVDFSAEAIQFALDKSDAPIKPDFRQGSAYELPWPNQTFDVVVSSDVIEHLKDVPHYLEEIKRVVKVGGVVIISTPIRFTDKPLDLEHVVEWFESEFVDVIHNQLPGAIFDKSHPVGLMELTQILVFGRPWPRVFISLFSLIKNPFVHYGKGWTFFALQYAAWVKK